MTKKVVIVIVVILVILGIWYIGKKSSAPAAQNNEVNQTATTSDQVSASVNDTSDASINQDLSNVDTQMNGLSSDTAGADQTGN